MGGKSADYYSFIIERFRYLINSKYRKGYGVHSPAVFEMVSKVLFDKAFYEDYKTIERQIIQLRSNKTKIPFTEMGAGSRFFSEGMRRISDIARESSVQKKYGRLLFRLIKYYKPEHVLELGTSLGVSTFYMAKGYENTKIHTMEGNTSVLEIAKVNAKELKLENIDFLLGSFDTLLTKLLSELKPLEFVFIDGNHSYEATIKYYSLIRSFMTKGIIVFDDIYWSQGMKKAWNEIKDKEHVTIDLFQLGIVVLGDILTPGTYRVRY